MNTTSVLIINDVQAGDNPNEYNSAKDIPTVPPSPKLDPSKKQLTPIALINVPIIQRIIFLECLLNSFDINSLLRLQQQ